MDKMEKGVRIENRGARRKTKPSSILTPTFSLLLKPSKPDNLENLMADPRTRLLTVFKERAVAFGKFTLASGKESSYYINSKKAIFHSEAVWLLGEVLWDITQDLVVEAAGGPEVGAIPMAAALAQRYHQGGRTLEGFFVRKHAKGHGSQERVEGVLKPGMRALVLDDVLTTGGSVLQAIAEIEKVGAQVAAVACIVDRLEGARVAISPQYEYRPIFTIRDFGIEPEERRMKNEE
jgi:orotate phosphoribosyltransferase